MLFTAYYNTFHEQVKKAPPPLNDTQKLIINTYYDFEVSPFVEKILQSPEKRELSVLLMDSFRDDPKRFSDKVHLQKDKELRMFLIRFNEICCSPDFDFHTLNLYWHVYDFKICEPAKTSESVKKSNILKELESLVTQQMRVTLKKSTLRGSL